MVQLPWVTGGYDGVTQAIQPPSNRLQDNTPRITISQLDHLGFGKDVVNIGDLAEILLTESLGHCLISLGGYWVAPS